jgi:hypothetical protein
MTLHSTSYRADGSKARAPGCAELAAGPVHAKDSKNWPAVRRALAHGQQHPGLLGGGDSARLLFTSWPNQDPGGVGQRSPPRVGRSPKEPRMASFPGQGHPGFPLGNPGCPSPLDPSPLDLATHNDYRWIELDGNTLSSKNWNPPPRTRTRPLHSGKSAHNNRQLRTVNESAFSQLRARLVIPCAVDPDWERERPCDQTFCFCRLLRSFCCVCWFAAGFSRVGTVRTGEKPTTTSLGIRIPSRRKNLFSSPGETGR